MGHKSMPKWRQAQFISLLLVEQMGAMLEASGSAVPREARRTYQRIATRQARMKEPLAGYGQKPLRAMTNKVKAVMQQIESEQVNLRSVCHLCLFLTEEISQTVRPDAVPSKRDWELLAGSLFTLVSHIDPDWENPDSYYQRQATRLGKKFWEIVS